MHFLDKIPDDVKAEVREVIADDALDYKSKYNAIKFKITDPDVLIDICMFLKVQTVVTEEHEQAEEEESTADVVDEVHEEIEEEETTEEDTVHNVNDALSITNIRSVILALARPLAEIVRNQMHNVKLIDEKVKDVEKYMQNGMDLEERLYVDQVKMIPKEIEYPKTVCTAATCVDYVKLNSNPNAATETIYRTECHPHCYLTGVQANICPNPQIQGCAAFYRTGILCCNKCKCPWNTHMHIRYILEKTMEKTLDPTVQASIKNRDDQVLTVRLFIEQETKRKNALQEEADKITQCCAEFAVFLRKNSILPYNDVYKEYVLHLIKEEKDKVARGGSTSLLNQLQNYKGEYEQQIKILEGRRSDLRGEKTIRQIYNMVDDLKRMEISGSILAEVQANEEKKPSLEEYVKQVTDTKRCAMQKVMAKGDDSLMQRLPDEEGEKVRNAYEKAAEPAGEPPFDKNNAESINSTSSDLGFLIPVSEFFDSVSEMNLAKKSGDEEHEEIEGEEETTAPEVASDFFDQFPDCLNSLILGGTGVVKSTFINGLVIHLKCGSIEEALRIKLEIVINAYFTHTNEAYNRMRVKYEPTMEMEGGGDQQNENTVEGQSSTQAPKSYVFSWNSKRSQKAIRIIDTPGVGDVRGVDKERLNFSKFLILLNQNESKLTVTFRFCINELLMRLHNSASQNILFRFTNCRQTQYLPGNTIPTLDGHLNELVTKRGLRIPLNPKTMFCFVNESFRFLCACSWNTHMHVRYVLEKIMEKTLAPTLHASIKNRGDQIQAARLFIEQETKRKKIIQCCVEFAAFFRKNSIFPYNDVYMEYVQHFIKEEKDKVARGCSTSLLNQLLNYKDEYEQQILGDQGNDSHGEKSIRQIFNMFVDDLKRMNISGSILAEVQKLEMLSLRDQQTTSVTPVDLNSDWLGKAARGDAKKARKMAKEAKEETGVVKSTFMNGLVNCLKYGSIEEALRIKVEILIKAYFTHSDEDYNRLRVEFEPTMEMERGGDEENELTIEVQSSTQCPKSYVFSWGPKASQKTIRIIGTPGVGDVRGVDQEKLSCSKILILLKPNESKLTVTFRFCINELLMHLHKSANQSIRFCFTNSRQTLYIPGDTLPTIDAHLKELASKQGIRIPLVFNTMLCYPNASTETIYRTECHSHCYLTGIQANLCPKSQIQGSSAFYRTGIYSCNKSRCPWNTHMHIRYILEKTMEKILHSTVHASILLLKNRDDQVQNARLLLPEAKRVRFFLLNPSESTKLTVTFRYCINELLIHLHTILFCFTNSRQTLYIPGDTLPTLDALLKELATKREIRIPLDFKTMFCFVSFLCGLREGATFEKKGIENFNGSWSKTVEEIFRLFKRISELPVHNVNDTLSVNNIRSVILALARPLTEIDRNQMRNVKLIEEKVKEVEVYIKNGMDLDGRLYVDQAKMIPKEIDYPKTVCTAASCVDYMKISSNPNTVTETIYITECRVRIGVESETIYRTECRVRFGAELETIYRTECHFHCGVVFRLTSATVRDQETTSVTPVDLNIGWLDTAARGDAKKEQKMEKKAKKGGMNGN